jgi:hypothetical protein
VKKHFDEYIVFYISGAIIGLIMAFAGCVAFLGEESKQKCIDSGYVYIEHHCYKNLPAEVTH